MIKPLWSRAKSSPDSDAPSTLPMVLPGEESAYEQTTPMPLASVRPATPPPPPAYPPEITLYDLMALIRRDNRVCPQPARWLEFYALLEQLSGGAKMPAPPLVGAAWAATPALAKRMCFREQVEWAAANNVKNAAWQYLRALPQADWYYMES